MKYFPLCQAENLRAGRFIAYFDNLVHWTEQKMSFKQVATGVTASLLESTGILSRALSDDVTRTKVPYWTRVYDKTQMGVPIEGRSPYLDYRVVEIAYSLPVSFLVRHGWHKWILRKAIDGRLPQAVV